MSSDPPNPGARLAKAIPRAKLQKGEGVSVTSTYQPLKSTVRAPKLSKIDQFLLDWVAGAPVITAKDTPFETTISLNEPQATNTTTSKGPNMWMIKLLRSGKALASGPLKSVGKWVAQNPGKSIVIGELLAEIMEWIFKALGRASDSDLDALLSVLRKNIPSVTWSSKRQELIQQMADYAAQSPSHRAAIMKALSEAGFTVELPDSAINYLNDQEMSEQDKTLLEEFQIAQGPSGRPGAGVSGFVVATERIRLLKRAARLVGGYDNWLILRASFGALDENDVERAREMDAVERGG